MNEMMKSVNFLLVLFVFALLSTWSTEAVELSLSEAENKEILASAAISCSQVSTASSASLLGQVIGTGLKRCQIVDATTCTTCACSYYVKYSTDSGSTWLGLTFQGTPGGTGCPGNGNTADAAKAWLLTKYIGQGYCCATAAVAASSL